MGGGGERGDATFNVPFLCNSATTRRRKLSGTDDCWDPTALNYNEAATNGAGCVYNVTGCTDSTALNYLPIANTDDGCTFPVYGCTDATATNFNSNATMLKGCVFAQPGCTDSNSTSYVPDANIDDGSCVYDIYGCGDASALNFDSTATVQI